jgi:hypothetical protein
MSDDAEDESKDESADDSEGQTEQQAANSDQSNAQTDDQPADQGSQADEQSGDQATDQAQEQPSDSDETGAQPDASGDTDEGTTAANTDNTVAFADSDTSVGRGGGGSGGADTAIEIRGSSFGGPCDPGFVDPEDSFKNCIQVPDDLTLALVDLTDPSAPVLAGIKDQDTVFIASMAKIAALYAAFELRKQLQDAISAVPVSTSVASLIAEVRKTWQPLLDATKPNDRAAFNGFPSLSEIFDIRPSGSTWNVKFTTKGDIGTLPDGEFAEWPLLKDKFGFKELLELMARFSNNDASARCITALSYEYIHGALANAGLYNQATGGLWLGAPYPHKPGAALTESLWAAEPLNNERNQSRKFQTGSAKAAATMFTLLAQGKLVDATASSEMLDMLDTRTNDFVRNALAADTLPDGSPARPIKSIRTKIGVIDKSYWSQTSLVERDLQDHGKPVRYVISILNNNSPSFYLNKDTISPLDQCIVNRHPGATRPSP